MVYHPHLFLEKPGIAWPTRTKIRDTWTRGRDLKHVLSSKGWHELVRCSDARRGRRFSLQEGCAPRAPTSLSALTVQTPYDTPSIPANKMAVFAFQFDGRVHQPPAVKVRVQQVGVFAQRTCW